MLPETLQPTAKYKRISAMDTIRGIALFGILLINIIGFGSCKSYFDPTNNGWYNRLESHRLVDEYTFFEGTTRGMFSMLFGAGILLFTGRKSENMEGTVVTDLFFRRSLWMLLFGVIHCYLLLWEEMSARSKGYLSILIHKLPLNQYWQTSQLYFISFWDTLAMMFLGIAFFKMGILKALKSKRFYLIMALIGYGIGITINYYVGWASVFT